MLLFTAFAKCDSILDQLMLFAALDIANHPRHPSKTQFIFEQLECMGEVAERGVGRKSVSDTNPDFLIKSQSVEHKSGQLPLFFKYHLILFHSMPFTRSKLSVHLNQKLIIRSSLKTQPV